MYKVYRRESAAFPKETLTLWYEVHFNGDNHEWRDCVSDVLNRIRNRYHVSEKSVPTFEPGEDFVELIYEIDGQEVNFSNDFLLYSIFVTAPTKETAEELRDFIAKQVGWIEP